MSGTTAIDRIRPLSALVAARRSPDEQAEIARLAARDREVRTHEAEHAAAAGSLAVGGPSFTYRTGPDGKLYAVGGEVHLNMNPGLTEEETISRAARIRAAALAPGAPSGADLEVVARATRMEDEARQARAAAASRWGIESASQLVRQGGDRDGNG